MAGGKLPAKIPNYPPGGIDKLLWFVEGHAQAKE
jgi:hypothetical protein